MNRNGETKEKLGALLLCILATGITGLGFVSPAASTVLSIALAAILVMRAEPGGLPAIAILWIRATDFFPSSAGSEGQGVSGAIFIAGFPLTLQFFTLIWITVRVLLEWLLRARRYRRSPWLTLSFRLWFLLLLIAMISAAWGYRLGHENWTQPLRAAMSLAAFFYGVIIAAKIEGRIWVIKWLVRIAALVLLLVAAGFYWNHIAFFYVPLGGVAFWYALQQRRWPLVIIFGLAPVVVSFSVGNTLTLIASAVVGLVAGFWLFYSNESLAITITSRWTRLILPIGIMLVLFVLFTDYTPFHGATGSIPGLADRFLSKLFLDRGPLWQAAWNSVVENPQAVFPAGRPLFVNSPNFYLPDNLWKVHVHNAYLEMFRQSGLLGGVVFLILVLRLWRKLRAAILQTADPLVTVVAIAALIASVIGATVGFYPFDFHAGPWIWLSIGITIGLVGTVGDDIVNEVRIRRPPGVNISSGHLGS